MVILEIIKSSLRKRVRMPMRNNTQLEIDKHLSSLRIKRVSIAVLFIIFSLGAFTECEMICS